MLLLRSEIEKAEQIIKDNLRDVGFCPLSVEECIYLYHKTKTWDITKWEGQDIPDGIGAI